MTTTIYLIRHAEAMGNIRRTFQGYLDEDLSPNGYAQLELLAERCKDFPFDAIYSSPLKRALLTAEAANRFHNLAIDIDPRLIEINGGDFEGVTFEELPHKFPEEYKVWDETPYLFQAPNGEAMAHVQQRMIEAVEDIARQNVGKCICIVSHGCAIKNYLCYAFGWEHQRMMEVGWCDNTAISCLELDDQLRPTVRFHNDNQHVGELSTFAKQTWWKKMGNGKSAHDREENA